MQVRVLSRVFVFSFSALPQFSVERCYFARAKKLIWPDGVTVSTLDFESSDGGSNPPRAFFLSHFQITTSIKIPCGGFTFCKL